jgi:hypothetical protein
MPAGKLVDCGANPNFRRCEETWYRKIEHSVMIRAQYQHIPLRVRPGMSTTKRANMMNLYVKVTLRALDPRLANLTSKIVGAFEQTCLRTIADNPHARGVKSLRRFVNVDGSIAGARNGFRAALLVQKCEFHPRHNLLWYWPIKNLPSKMYRVSLLGVMVQVLEISKVGVSRIALLIFICSKK